MNNRAFRYELDSLIGAAMRNVLPYLSNFSIAELATRLPVRCKVAQVPVSYTHLDVYKRQVSRLETS